MRSSEGENLVDHGKERREGRLGRAVTRIAAGFQGPEAVAALRRARFEAKAAQEAARLITRELAFVHVERADPGEATGHAVSVREQPATARINFELPTRLEWCDSVLTHRFGGQVRGQWPTLPGGIARGFAADDVAQNKMRPAAAGKARFACVEMATLTVNSVLIKTLVLDELGQLIGTLPSLRAEQFEEIAQAAGICYAHYRISSASHGSQADPLIRVLFPTAPGVSEHLSVDLAIHGYRVQRHQR